MRRGVSRSNVSARKARAGFTLFELILAVGLSTTLLMMIATSIDLFLVHTDASRSRVQDAQLARSVMNYIASDIQEAFVPRSQDTSGLSQLISSAASQNSGGNSGGGDGNQGSGSGGGQDGGNQGGAQGGGGQTGGAGGQGDGGDSAAEAEAESDSAVLPIGLYGTLSEIRLDVLQQSSTIDALLFQTIDTAAGESTTDEEMPVGGVSTIEWYLRDGVSLEPADSFQSVFAEDSLGIHGLVRQELPRPVLDLFEQSVRTDTRLERGIQLVAPEVANLEFRYFNGTEYLEEWDSQVEGTLPMAVEIKVWIETADQRVTGDTVAFNLDRRTVQAREYTMLVPLTLGGQSTSGSSGGGAAAGGSQTSP